MKRFLKNSYLALCAVLMLTAGACNDVFDELSKNPNQLDVNGFYSSPESVNKGVTGIYGYLTTPRNLGACAFGLMLNRGDEGSSVADYGVPGEYSERYTPSYYSLVQPFQLMYTAASQACQIIDVAPKVAFGDLQQQNAYLGEAYFLRGFGHFFLLVNYRHIPLIKELPASANEYKPQATPEEAWDFIIDDLKKAKELLPPKGYWGYNDAGRATSGSAAALLGKAYLYRTGIEKKYGNSTKEYYTEAAEAFGEIISGKHGAYELADNYSWNFDTQHENNDESVWELQFVGDVVNTGFNPGFINSGLFSDLRCKMPPIPLAQGGNESNAQVIHRWVYDLFAASKDEAGFTDPRMFHSFIFDDSQPEIRARPGMKVTVLNGEDWQQTYGNEGFAAATRKAAPYKLASRKWCDWTLPAVNPGNDLYFFNGRAQGVNWRMIRLADVLLMYAEAVTMGGVPSAVTALEAVNRVRNRVGMPPVNSVDMEVIEKERVLELTWEGHRFYDLLRWGKVAERFRELGASDPYFKQFNGATYLGFQENKHEWVPLPIDEVESNPYITQNNPGW